MNRFLREKLNYWFETKGMRPWNFQTRTWDAYLNGLSGLIHVPTGSGKTFAAFGGPLCEIEEKQGLQILYLSPLRAVIRDVEKALIPLATFLHPNITVETKTGDTSSKVRARQSKRMPNILLTTPESLGLLLTRKDFLEIMKNVKCVILDEWHELMGSKRGLQVELALSHLLPRVPKARVWAMSGTLNNLEECAQVAVGVEREPLIITQKFKREINVTTIIPDDALSLPWAGHLGMRMLPEVIKVLNQVQSTLIFTNTRSQAERWYQEILNAVPEMAGAMALHHSAIEAKTRLYIEDAVKTGGIKWVVCTSSLDLGVDFGLVEKVIQIGSAKGVARLLQRAGRANHRPNESAELAFVPTQAMEVAEIVAIKKAVKNTEVESRKPFRGAVDVLEQHIVSCACGEPTSPDEIFQEVLQTVSYHGLTRKTFDWMIEHLVTGGALHHYPQYKKLVWTDDGTKRLTIASNQLARFHKLSIGTIVSDATIGVFFTNQKKLGNIEEGYLARLRKGDKFLFAGRTLELVMMKDARAFVKLAKGKSVQTPRWMGGKMPISTTVCHELRAVFDRASHGSFEGMSDAEKAALQPLFQVHSSISQLPKENEILVEFSTSRDGAHVFLFPFEGRLVHEGMAALLAYRLSRIQKATFGLSVNDYGIEILSENKLYPLNQLIMEHWNELWKEQSALIDLSHSIQAGAYSKRHFREIARVAGLIFQGYPGAQKSGRQLQVSSSLLYDVLEKYEPDNLLVQQAHQEVLERQFEATRLLDQMQRVRTLIPLWMSTKKFSPFAFPLVFERSAAVVSSETLVERLERMKKSWISEVDHHAH